MRSGNFDDRESRWLAEEEEPEVKLQPGDVAVDVDDVNVKPTKDDFGKVTTESSTGPVTPRNFAASSVHDAVTPRNFGAASIHDAVTPRNFGASSVLDGPYNGGASQKTQETLQDFLKSIDYAELSSGRTLLITHYFGKSFRA